MSETQFRPGPWCVVECFSIGEGVRVRTADDLTAGETICSMIDREYTFSNWDKNAQLIAAAPDLYAALEQARIVLGEAGSDEHLKQLTDEELGRLWSSAVKLADAALAKACGVESKP